MLNAGRRVAAVAIVALAGFTLCARTAIAQGSTSVVSPITFGISGGVSVPMEDLADGSRGFTGVNTGYNVTGSLGIGLPALPFSLRADASYNGFGTKNFSFAAMVPQSGFNADARVLGFTANVVFPIHPLPTPIIHPYLIGGAGVYNVRISPTTGGSTSQSNFGFNLGAGVSVPFVLFDGFIEARYHHVTQDNGSIAFVPITVGVMF